LNVLCINVSQFRRQPGRRRAVILTCIFIAPKSIFGKKTKGTAYLRALNLIQIYGQARGT